MSLRSVLFAVALSLAACGKAPAPQSPSPGALSPPPRERPAAGPSAYRVNATLPHGSILVTVKARKPVAPGSVDIPPDFRTRNPEEAAFCSGCASRGSLPDEALAVDSGTLGIRNVAVSLRAIDEGPRPPLAKLTLDNSCCRFSPRVGFAPIGLPVAIRNSDPMSHAAMFWTLSGTQLYSVTIPSGETTDTTVVDVPGILEVTCPIHQWMRAWIVASRHPYVAVTDERGEARLDRVPGGSQEIVFWHERLGSTRRPAAVVAGLELRVELSDGDFAKR